MNTGHKMHLRVILAVWLSDVTGWTGHQGQGNWVTRVRVTGSYVNASTTVLLLVSVTIISDCS